MLFLSLNPLHMLAHGLLGPLLDSCCSPLSLPGTDTVVASRLLLVLLLSIIAWNHRVRHQFDGPNITGSRLKVFIVIQIV